MLFAHLGPQPERPPAPPGPAKYVALLSGLGIGEGGDPARLALALDYLGGFLGGATEQAMAAQARAACKSGYSTPYHSVITEPGAQLFLQVTTDRLGC